MGDSTVSANLFVGFTGGYSDIWNLKSSNLICYVLNSDYTCSELPKALFMSCHVFYCARHLHKFRQLLTWLRC